jgi:hypothetical protein
LVALCVSASTAPDFLIGPPRFNSARPNSPAADAREECWHVYYGDVHVGAIAIRIGIPLSEEPWGWICGFYWVAPGRARKRHSASFDEARLISKPQAGISIEADRSGAYPHCRSDGQVGDDELKF